MTNHYLPNGGASNQFPNISINVLTIRWWKAEGQVITYANWELCMNNNKSLVLYAIRVVELDMCHYKPQMSLSCNQNHVEHIRLLDNQISEFQ